MLFILTFGPTIFVNAPVSTVALSQCWHSFTLTFGGCLLFTVYTGTHYSSSDDSVSLALETGCAAFLPVGFVFLCRGPCRFISCRIVRLRCSGLANFGEMISLATFLTCFALRWTLAAVHEDMCHHNSGMSVTSCALSECLLVFGFEIQCPELDTSFVEHGDRRLILPLNLLTNSCRCSRCYYLLFNLEFNIRKRTRFSAV